MSRSRGINGRWKTSKNNEEREEDETDDGNGNIGQPHLSVVTGQLLFWIVVRERERKVTFSLPCHILPCGQLGAYHIRHKLRIPQLWVLNLILTDEKLLCQRIVGRMSYTSNPVPCARCHSMNQAVSYWSLGSNPPKCSGLWAIAPWPPIAPWPSTGQGVVILEFCHWGGVRRVWNLWGSNVEDFCKQGE